MDQRASRTFAHGNRRFSYNVGGIRVIEWWYQTRIPDKM
jgi:hypothetical protein